MDLMRLREMWKCTLWLCVRDDFTDILHKIGVLSVGSFNVGTWLHSLSKTHANCKNHSFTLYCDGWARTCNGLGLHGPESLAYVNLTILIYLRTQVKKKEYDCIVWQETHLGCRKSGFQGNTRDFTRTVRRQWQKSGKKSLDYCQARARFIFSYE